MSLNSKDRAILKSIASTMSATCIVGANGVTENVISQIKMDFLTRELCKIKFLPNAEVSAREVAEGIANQVHAEIVTVIGNFLILYKLNNRKNYKHLLNKDL